MGTHCGGGWREMTDELGVGRAAGSGGGRETIWMGNL